MMYSMFAMITLGIGEIIGGLFIGQVIDRIGNYFSTFVGIGLILI